MEIVSSPARTKSTSRYICAVRGCNSKSNKNLDLFFHTFPKSNSSVVQIENIFEKLDRLEAWKRVLKIKDPTPRMRVCSLHFNESDYILPNFKLQRKKLKNTSVPSRNLQCSEAAKKTKSNNARLQQTKINRSIKKEAANNVKEQDPLEIFDVAEIDTLSPECSKDDEDVEMSQGLKLTRRILKKGVVPSVFDRNKSGIWMNKQKNKKTEKQPKRGNLTGTVVPRDVENGSEPSTSSRNPSTSYLENDVENYMRFKLMKNVRLKLKNDVVPHIFDGQERQLQNDTSGGEGQKNPVKLIVLNLDGSVSNNSTVGGGRSSSVFIKNETIHTNVSAPTEELHQAPETAISEIQIKQEYMHIDIEDEGVQSVDRKEDIYIHNNIGHKQEYIIPDRLEPEMREHIYIKQEIKEENLDS